MNIVLHSDDINLIAHWQKAIKEEVLIVDEVELLNSVKNSLVVLNYSACKSESESIINELNKNENKVLILHRVPDFITAQRVLKYGAMGYGNALMREHFIVSAIQTINENMVWLYPEFTSQLISNMPQSKSDKNIQLLKLSEREKEVAMLLKEGDTYKVIARQLGITPRTVKAHAQHIYTKLNVKDRLGLALLLK